MKGDRDRIDALEERLAFQDDTIQQLNDALVAQQTRIDSLESELQGLIEETRSGLSDAPINPVDELPPHY